MTGFGAGAASAGGTSVAVEVRSVNNRFLKVQTRLPDGFAEVEPRIEAAVRKRLNRGAVSVGVRLETAGQTGRLTLAVDVLDGYRADAEAYALASGLAAPTDLAAYLRLPGVVREEAADPGDPTADAALVLQATEEALDALNAFRDREGAAMADELRGQIDAVRTHLSQVEARAPGLAEEFRRKLHARVSGLLAEAGAEMSPADLTREVIVYADKADVTEEIVRLRTHLDAFDAALSEDAPGRKLDFLTQEINREINTVGSKANDADLAGAVVGMKGAVEKLREILQNLE
ncbi:YicC/YloC family endoribonuclease [Alienimonas sp. DA493]|uniref:YicC/YloC family endoribonuclease n=1 Tax=Alienimonas sp. DA493 TaxID=3373605 RepID=UPI00375448E8